MRYNPDRPKTETEIRAALRKADFSFKIAKAQLMRGEEKDAYARIAEAAQVGHPESMFYHGAKLLEQGDLANGLSFMRQSISPYTSHADAYWQGIEYMPQPSNEIDGLIEYGTPKELYASAQMNAGVNAGRCMTNSVVALLKAPHHPEAAQTSERLESLLKNVSDFKGTKYGIMAQMKDGTHAPVEAIPAAIKAIVAYNQYRKNEGSRVEERGKVVAPSLRDTPAHKDNVAAPVRHRPAVEVLLPQYRS